MADDPNWMEKAFSKNKGKFSKKAKKAGVSTLSFAHKNDKGNSTTAKEARLAEVGIGYARGRK